MRQRFGGVSSRSSLLLSLLLFVGLPILLALTPPPPPPVEAPAGFDDLTNGFATQAQFDLDKETFEDREKAADGLARLPHFYV
jgi:hypothetical protein